MNDDTQKAERAQRLAIRKADHQARVAVYLANTLRDAPIRARFHAWLETEGFAPQSTPGPGGSYPGAHVEMLWECYLAATLAEREASASTELLEAWKDMLFDNEGLEWIDSDMPDNDWDLQRDAAKEKAKAAITKTTGAS